MTIAIQNASQNSVSDYVYIAVSLIMGSLYDVIGRRIPLSIYYVTIALGWGLLPLHWGSATGTLWTGWFISNNLIANNWKIWGMPYIPDLIQEDS